MQRDHEYLLDILEAAKLAVSYTISKTKEVFLNGEKIFLNPTLIHASKDCIDYVIAHELCHMKYKKHDDKFFKLLGEKYPNCETVKEKLENYLAC